MAFCAMCMCDQKVLAVLNSQYYIFVAQAKLSRARPYLSSERIAHEGLRYKYNLQLQVPRLFTNRGEEEANHSNKELYHCTCGVRGFLSQPPEDLSHSLDLELLFGT